MTSKPNPDSHAIVKVGADRSRTIVSTHQGAREAETELLTKHADVPDLMIMTIEDAKRGGPKATASATRPASTSASSKP